MGFAEKLRLGLVLALGVIIPGVADYVLKSAGYPTLGGIAFASGYGLALFVVWYVWFRPLDITGPSGG